MIRNLYNGLNVINTLKTNRERRTHYSRFPRPFRDFLSDAAKPAHTTDSMSYKCPRKIMKTLYQHLRSVMKMWQYRSSVMTTLYNCRRNCIKSLCQYRHNIMTTLHQFQQKVTSALYKYCRKVMKTLFSTQRHDTVE